MKFESFQPAPLPPEFRWLEKETEAPKVIKNALKFYGLREIVGPKHEPIIIEMGQFLGGPVASWIKDDENAWCGTFAAFILKLSDFEPPAGFAAVRAREYANFGNAPKAPPVAALGDILAFWRGSPQGRDGHVGFYIAETRTHYIVLGGNQNNAVGFTKIEKGRLIAARRCPWKIAQPKGVRPILIDSAGVPTSVNEA